MSFLRRFSDATTTTLTDAATIAIDVSTGPNFMVTLGGNRTLGNPTNSSATKEVWLAVKQDATGSRTLAFDTDWVSADGTATINPAANSVTIINAINRDFGSGEKWYYTVMHAAETGGGGGDNDTDTLAGVTNATTTLRNTEVVVGGFKFDPTGFSTFTFRLVGDLATTDTGGDAQLRLYDMGPGTGAFTPVRRSTVTITYANRDNRIFVEQALTTAGSPGTNTNEIHTTARVYELRMYLNTTDIESSFYVSWGGFAVS